MNESLNFPDYMQSHEICFQMCKLGQLARLKKYLSDKTKEERHALASQKHVDATCLLAACQQGHLEIVKYLVEDCLVDLEQCGTVSIDEYKVEEAFPLWCASAIGNLEIVEYLLGRGVRVNATTRSKSTSLRVACFYGNLSVVKYLIDKHNADLEIANEEGSTCIMIACFNNHFEVVEYLINKGANLNRKTLNGNTVLHECAESKEANIKIMKLLLDKGAKMMSGVFDLRPIMVAAVKGNENMVYYLLSRPECDELEKISALEVLGATFIMKISDTDKAHKYWSDALQRRNNNHYFGVSNSNIKYSKLSTMKDQAVKNNPIEAYDYAIEFMNEKELVAVMADTLEVKIMQAVLVCERILGPSHPTTIYNLHYLGAYEADNANFEKCFKLWLHVLKQLEKSKPLNMETHSLMDSFIGVFEDIKSNHLTKLKINKDSKNYEQLVSLYTTTMFKVLQHAVNDEIKRGIDANAANNETKHGVSIMSDETRIRENLNNDDELSIGMSKMSLLLKSKLDTALQCPICFEIACAGFKSLGCGHVICKQCLEKIKNLKETSKSDDDYDDNVQQLVKCPVCKREKSIADIRDLF